MNPASFNKRLLVTNGIAPTGRTFSSPKYLVILFIIVIFNYFSVSVPASGTDLPDSLQTEVPAAFDRVDKLLEELKYDEAARILEEMLVNNWPLEVKIEINTKLAFVYEQNRYEQKAIDCLLENLRIFPSYGLPDSLKEQLQHLYDVALEIYQKEWVERNLPPEFVDMPRSINAVVGQRIQFVVLVRDPDGDSLQLSASRINGVSFIDRYNGTGLFTYTPISESAGSKIQIWFFADDGLVQDSSSIIISIRIAPPASAARAIAMGQTGIAIGLGVSAMLRNPARLTQVRRLEIFSGLSHFRLNTTTHQERNRYPEFTSTISGSESNLRKTHLVELSGAIGLSTNHGNLVFGLGVHRVRNFDRTGSLRLRDEAGDYFIDEQLTEIGSGGLYAWSAAALCANNSETESDGSFLGRLEDVW